MNKIVLISAVLASLFTTQAMADTYNNETNNLSIEQTHNTTCNDCVFFGGADDGYGDEGGYRETTRTTDRYEEHTHEVIKEFNK